LFGGHLTLSCWWLDCHKKKESPYPKVETLLGSLTTVLGLHFSDQH
jgi:hypothetical protein